AFSVVATGHRWSDPRPGAAIESPAAWRSVEPSGCSGRFARTDRARPVAGIPPGCRAGRLPPDFGGRARDEHIGEAGFRSCDSFSPADAVSRPFRATDPGIRSV